MWKVINEEITESILALPEKQKDKKGNLHYCSWMVQKIHSKTVAEKLL